MLTRRHIIFIDLAAALLFGLMWAAAVGESVALVFAGMLPTFIFIVSLFYYEQQMQPIPFWFTPAILCILFLWTAASGVPVYGGMLIPVVATVNAVLSYLFAVLFWLAGIQSKQTSQEDVQEQEAQVSSEAQETDYQQLAHAYAHQSHHYAQQNQQYADHIRRLQEELHRAKQHTVTDENLTRTLRSIEDKCKAINFVVGRVYSDKRGGSPEIREKLTIPREWYNAFSEITADYEKEDAAQLLDVLGKIYSRLLVLHQAEKDAFKPIKDAQLPVDREPKGEEMILSVLAKNDKDPVMDYYAEAKEICEQLITYLKAQ